jgi:hypothetical protein
MSFVKIFEFLHHIGAGAGRKYAPIAKVPLTPEALATTITTSVEDEVERHAAEEPALLIAEFKRRLATRLGIDSANIKITVEA